MKRIEAFGFLCLLLVAGCGADHAPALRTLLLTPGAAVINSGADQAFEVTAVSTDGSTENYTALVDWTSSDPAILQAAPARPGVFTALAVGTATVTATDSGTGKTSNATVQVSNASLVSITLAPNELSLPLGVTRQLHASGIYSDGTTLDLTESLFLMTRWSGRA